MMNQPKTGSCQCGAVRFELHADPVDVYCCHCLECRKQSASAFGISMPLPAAAFNLLQGTPKKWSRPTNSGGEIDCYFCGTCGSRLWHENSKRPDIRIIKGGALDEGVSLENADHIWTCRTLPGLPVASFARTHDRGKDMAADRETDVDQDK